MGVGEHRDLAALPFLFNAYGLPPSDWWDMLERLKALANTHDTLIREQQESEAEMRKAQATK